jgi:signal transduction histidine kinase
MSFAKFTRRGSGRRVARLSRLSDQMATAALAEPARLEDILMTRKLTSRRRRRPNSYAENAALHTLARVMANAPNELIDTLLRLAIELCGAGTAGLSLLETPAQGDPIFRWANLTGALNKHLGASTPRNFSLCGVTIARNEPQLFTYPARHFQYLNDLDFTIVEALVVPVYLGTETPGTIWIVSHDDEMKFDSEDARIMIGLAEFATCALQITRLSDMQRTVRMAGDKEIAAHKVTEDALRLTQSKLEFDIDLRVTQVQQLSARLLNLQDEERRQIARELHDSAGQYLAGIQMNLSALLSQPAASGPSETSRISDSLKMADQCQSEIRTISYLLHPPLLDETGLPSTLSWYVEGFAKRSGIRVDLEIAETLGRLPSEIETALFRVTQQGLANIHRHSKSKVARIVLGLSAEWVTLLIADTGCGISPEILREFHSGTRLPGVGMAGMRERIRNIGGHFDVQSNSKGTTIQVRVPLPTSAGSPFLRTL